MGRTDKAQEALGSEENASSHCGPPAARDGKKVYERPLRRRCFVPQLFTREDITLARPSSRLLSLLYFFDRLVTEYRLVQSTAQDLFSAFSRGVPEKHHWLWFGITHIYSASYACSGLCVLCASSCTGIKCVGVVLSMECPPFLSVANISRNCLLKSCVYLEKIYINRDM